MAKRSSGLRFQPAGGERKAQVPVGKKQRLKIARLANDGRGIAFLDGRSWFVSGALPGEEVEARVLNARSQVVEARAERIFSSATIRRQPLCRHAGHCGGCTVQHLPHDEQLALKQRNLTELLQRQGGAEPEAWEAPLTGPEFGYRRRARIAVRWDARRGELEVGFRASASQDIVALAECPVLVQPLQPILEALPRVLRGLDKPQAIGHVELFHGNASAVLVRHTAPLGSDDVQRLRDFCSDHDAQLWLQGVAEPEADGGERALGYRLENWNLALNYRPGDFVQVNGPVNEAMVRQALDWLAPQPEERVLDMFCGLGNFALPLAQKVKEVVAIEGVQVMVDRARTNAEANGLANLHFMQADLSKPLAEADWARKGFDAMLLDPPRDGAFEVVKGIRALGIKRLVYVSCNPATLARDTAELLKQGYRLRRAGILDMFPQTAHVEAMALFETGQSRPAS